MSGSGETGGGFAPLSAGLLARKGHARPAMRPGNHAPAPRHAVEDDLGWNDMGAEPPRAPLPLPPVPPANAPAAPPATAIAHQQAAIADALGVAQEPAAATRLAAGSREKAAFTLRLDADRHLRLRLACAIGQRSAQQIVIEALDRYLAAHPEIDALAERIPAAAPRSSRRTAK